MYQREWKWVCFCLCEGVGVCERERITLHLASLSEEKMKKTEDNARKNVEKKSDVYTYITTICETHC